jgi:hypothetical protein
MSEWAVPVTDEVLAALADDFERGPILDDRGRRALEEAAVGVLNGLRVEIFAREHPPAHFRVRYQGQSANFDICTGQPLTAGLERWHRNIKKWHAENRQVLIDKWNKSRPTDCPVGRVECR